MDFFGNNGSLWWVYMGVVVYMFGSFVDIGGGRYFIFNDDKFSIEFKIVDIV